MKVRSAKAVTNYLPTARDTSYPTRSCNQNGPIGITKLQFFFPQILGKNQFKVEFRDWLDGSNNNGNHHAYKLPNNILISTNCSTIVVILSDFGRSDLHFTTNPTYDRK